MSYQAITNMHRANVIKRTLGMRCAAGFLRNRNVSLDEALIILLGKK